MRDFIANSTRYIGIALVLAIIAFFFIQAGAVRNSDEPCGPGYHMECFGIDDCYCFPDDYPGQIPYPGEY